MTIITRLWSVVSLPRSIESFEGWGRAITVRLLAPTVCGAGALLLLLPFSTIAAQDTNTYEPPSSHPEALYRYESHLYFSADDGIHGRELWRIASGSPAELLKDIMPGPGGTAIDQFIPFKGKLYFRAQPDGDPGELWRTDGTATGTVQIHTSTESSDLNSVSFIGAASERYLYYTQGSRSNSSTVWKTDGSDGGSKPLLSPDGQRLVLDNFAGVVADKKFYFTARSGPGDAEVWVFDESREATTRLAVTATAASDFTAFTESEVHFTAGAPETGEEYWISTGTPDSTRQLIDIAPGLASSSPGGRVSYPTESGQRRVVFAATHPETGREVWESDGTPEGTRLFADLIPGAESSNPYVFHVSGSKLYFIALGDGKGKELWGYTHGMAAPRMVADLNPGTASSEPYALCLDRAGGIFFSALTPAEGEELWYCSSPEDAPLLIRDFIQGRGSSFPYYTTRFDGQVAVVATSGLEGREIWLANGPSREVTLLADIHTTSSVNPSSSPRQLTPAGEWLFFVADDIAHGRELWRTNGSPEHTQLVKDIFPGRPGSNPEQLTALGHLLYFTADDGVHGAELWRSDGSDQGTALVMDINLEGGASIQHVTSFGDSVIFSAQTPGEGEEPWILRPGKQPDILMDIAVGPASSRPREFVVWKNHVYFRANNGAYGEELWRTSGTRESTKMVRDIIDTPYEALSLGEVGRFQDMLYISANINGTGEELWRVNVNAGGRLELLRDIASPLEYRMLVQPPAD